MLCCELSGHVTKNLYLIMVVSHGRNLAEDENVFFSCLQWTFVQWKLESQWTKNGQKDLYESVYILIPEQRVCVGGSFEVLFDKHDLSCFWAFAHVFAWKFSLTSSASFVNSYSSFSFQLNVTFSKKPF